MQTEILEASSGRLDDPQHESLPHSLSARLRQDVQMPDPPNAVVARIRIDIQPADPEKPAGAACAEQSFSRPVKPIRPVAPFVYEPTDDT